MQRLRRLSRRRAARLDESAFVIDGPVLVNEARAAGIRLREAFIVEHVDPELEAQLTADGVTVHEVTADVLARAVDAVTPQGVAAIGDRPEVPLADALSAAAAGPLALVLVDVTDPGNAGTLLRTAEAAGASAVLFCGHSVDPCNPKCVRASAGGLFHLPVAQGGDAVTVLERLVDGGVTTAATVARGGTAYDAADLTGPLALLLGSEAHGLPRDLVDRVDLSLSIPMAGRAESLNVAMAGSVIAFEALRQRRATSP